MCSPILNKEIKLNEKKDDILLYIKTVFILCEFNNPLQAQIMVVWGNSPQHIPHENVFEICDKKKK